MGVQITSMKLTAGSSFNGADISVTQPGIGTSAELYQHHAQFPVIERVDGVPDLLTGQLHPWSRFVVDRDLARRHIIRIDYGSGRYERYRVEGLSGDTAGGNASYRAVRIWADLGRTKFRYSTGTGPVWDKLPGRGKTVAQAMAIILDTANGVDAFFQVGNIDAAFSSDIVSIEADDSSHLELIRNVIEQLKTARPVFRETDTQCFVDIVPVSTVAVNAKILGPQGDDTEPANRISLQMSADPGDYVSKVFPVGNDESLRMNKMRWAVTNFQNITGGVRINLADSRLVWRDDCWNGYGLRMWLARDRESISDAVGTGAPWEITETTIDDCDAAAGTITVPTQTIDPDLSFVQVVDASGNVVDFVADEIREAADGRSELTLPLPSANPHVDYFSAGGGSGDMSSGSTDGSGNYIPDQLSLLVVEAKLYIKSITFDSVGNIMKLFGDQSSKIKALDTFEIPYAPGVDELVFDTEFTASIDASYNSSTDETTVNFTPGIITPAQSWSSKSAYLEIVLTASTSEATADSDFRYGSKSVRIEFPAAGTGLRSSQFLGMKFSWADRPFWSAWMAGRVIKGKVRLSVIDDAGGGRRLPFDVNGATMVADDVRAVAASWEKADGTVVIYIEAMEEDTVFVLDALTLCNSERGVEYSDGMGHGDVVAKAAAFLQEEGSLDAPMFSAEFFDLKKLVGGSWVTPEVGDIVTVKDQWDGSAYAIDESLMVTEKREKLLSDSFAGTMVDVEEGVKLQNRRESPSIIDDLAGVSTAFSTTPTSSIRSSSAYAPLYDMLDVAPAPAPIGQRAIYPTIEGWRQIDSEGDVSEMFVKSYLYASEFGVKADYDDLLLTGTDNTVLLNNAIAAAAESGRDLVLPPGNIHTTSIIVPTALKAFTIRGAGKWATKIFATGLTTSGPSAFLTFDGDWLTTQSMRVELRDLSIYGDDDPDVTGVYIDYGSHFMKLENILISGFWDGLRLADCWNMTFQDVECNANINNGITIGYRLDDSTATCNALRFFGGRTAVNGMNGVEHIAGANLLFSGVDMEGNKGCGLYSEFGLGVTINSCYSENIHIPYVGWTSGVLFSRGDTVSVIYNGYPLTFVAKSDHLSSLSNEPLSGASWEDEWQRSAGYYFYNSRDVAINGTTHNIWSDDTVCFWFRTATAAMNSSGVSRGTGAVTPQPGMAVYAESGSRISMSAPDIRAITHGIRANSSVITIDTPRFVGVDVPFSQNNSSFSTLIVRGCNPADFEMSEAGSGQLSVTTIADDGSGNCRITIPAGHSYVVDDRIYLRSSVNGYGLYDVLSVPSGTTLDLDVPFVGDDACQVTSPDAGEYARSSWMLNDGTRFERHYRVTGIFDADRVVTPNALEVWGTNETGDGAVGVGIEFRNATGTWPNGPMIAPIMTNLDGDQQGISFWVHPTSIFTDPRELALVIDSDKYANFEQSVRLKDGSAGNGAPGYLTMFSDGSGEAHVRVGTGAAVKLGGGDVFAGAALADVQLVIGDGGTKGVKTIVAGSDTADLKDLLVVLGVVSDSGATPIDLDGGLLTAGSVTTADVMLTTESVRIDTADGSNATLDLYEDGVPMSRVRWNGSTGALEIWDGTVSHSFKGGEVGIGGSVWSGQRLYVNGSARIKDELTVKGSYASVDGGIRLKDGYVPGTLAGYGKFYSGAAGLPLWRAGGDVAALLQLQGSDLIGGELLELRKTTAGSGTSGGAIYFQNDEGSRASANCTRIELYQGGSDSDAVGIDLYTHASGTFGDPAVLAVRIHESGVFGAQNKLYTSDDLEARKGILLKNNAAPTATVGYASLYPNAAEEPIWRPGTGTAVQIIHGAQQLAMTAPITTAATGTDAAKIDNLQTRVDELEAIAQFFKQVA